MVGNLGEGLRKQEVCSSLGAGRRWAKYRIGHLHDFYAFRGNGQSCDWLESNLLSFLLTRKGVCLVVFVFYNDLWSLFRHDYSVVLFMSCSIRECPSALGVLWIVYDWVGTVYGLSVVARPVSASYWQRPEAALPFLSFSPFPLHSLTFFLNVLLASFFILFSLPAVLTLSLLH